jgi:hypothetical protein
MANGRERTGKKVDTDRMPGGFSPIPWSVLDSKAYLGLSHPARSLLLEVARQDTRSSNGRLLLSSKHLAKRGWKSNDTIHRAKTELLHAGLIYETVKGHRPNKASWYAVTWYRLYPHRGFDVGAVEGFRLGAYLDSDMKNTGLKPSHGVASTPIAPSAGSKAADSAPGSGLVVASTDATPIP